MTAALKRAARSLGRRPSSGVCRWPLGGVLCRRIRQARSRLLPCRGTRPLGRASLRRLARRARPVRHHRGAAQRQLGGDLARDWRCRIAGADDGETRGLAVCRLPPASAPALIAALARKNRCQAFLRLGAAASIWLAVAVGGGPGPTMMAARRRFRGALAAFGGHATLIRGGAAFAQRRARLRAAGPARSGRAECAGQGELRSAPHPETPAACIATSEEPAMQTSFSLAQLADPEHSGIGKYSAHLRPLRLLHRHLFRPMSCSATSSTARAAAST